MRKRMNCYGLADDKQIIKIRAIRGDKPNFIVLLQPEICNLSSSVKTYKRNTHEKKHS